MITSSLQWWQYNHKIPNVRVVEGQVRTKREENEHVSQLIRSSQYLPIISPVQEFLTSSFFLHSYKTWIFFRDTDQPSGLTDFVFNFLIFPPFCETTPKNGAPGSSLLNTILWPTNKQRFMWSLTTRLLFQFDIWGFLTLGFLAIFFCKNMTTSLFH